MNKTLCKFTILRYVPDEYREEFMNIGLIMHVPSEGAIATKFTKNFSRLKSFDDEIDIGFLKIILEGIDEQFSTVTSTVTGPSDLNARDENFLYENTRHYVNQLQFSQIRNIYSSNYVADFDKLFKTYVYFDTKKPNRITSDEVKNLMWRTFEEKGLDKKLEPNPRLQTKHEDIYLDFKYESSNTAYYLKAFSLDYKRKNTASNLAKAWAYNIEQLNKTNEAEFRFIINNSDLKNQTEKLIYGILSDVSEPISLKDFDQYLDSIKGQSP